MLSRGVRGSPASLSIIALATPLPNLATRVSLGVRGPSLGGNALPTGLGFGGVVRATIGAVGGPNSGTAVSGLSGTIGLVRALA